MLAYSGSVLERYSFGRFSIIRGYGYECVVNRYGQIQNYRHPEHFSAEVRG